MAFAVGYHVVRGELAMLPINVGLGSLATWVAWARFNERRV